MGKRHGTGVRDIFRQVRISTLAGDMPRRQKWLGRLQKNPQKNLLKVEAIPEFLGSLDALIPLNISDWLRNADVSRVLPLLPCWRVATLMYSLHFRTSHDYLLPPTTNCRLLRLPVASYDYLPPPMTTCCQPLVLRCACLEKDLRHLALDCFYGVVTAQKAP
jgi:hypothetical protein